MSSLFARPEGAPRGRGGYLAAKRAFDVLASASLLVLGAPLLCAIGLVVRLGLGRPVFFVQLRPGRDEALFRLYKFRTMREATQSDGRVLSDAERLTGLGRWLRRTSLDELPELVNILKGDMSFVGPRPLLPEYLPLYSERERARHAVRPGLTGLAQVSGRNHLPWKERLELDAQYVDRMSLRLDAWILLRTIPIVLSRRGVSQKGTATMERFRGWRETGGEPGEPGS